MLNGLGSDVPTFFALANIPVGGLQKPVIATYDFVIFVSCKLVECRRGVYDGPIESADVDHDEGTCETIDGSLDYYFWMGRVWRRER